MKKKVCTILALASCCTAAARAADPPAVPESLLACSKLEDPGDRVRCYDAQIAPSNASPPATPAPSGASAPVTAPGALATSPNAVSPAAAPAPIAPAVAPAAAAVAPAAAVVPPKEPAAAPAITAKQFGSDSMPASARPLRQKQKPSPLLSSIKSLQTVGTAPRYVISLANGQVWRQEGASNATFFFRVGEDVRIEHGAFGSYHLFTSATGPNWIQVIRVQ